MTCYTYAPAPTFVLIHSTIYRAWDVPKEYKPHATTPFTFSFKAFFPTTTLAALDYSFPCVVAPVESVIGEVGA